MATSSDLFTDMIDINSWVGHQIKGHLNDELKKSSLMEYLKVKARDCRIGAATFC